MEFKIPVVLAVGFWAASALAVTTYTYIAFKETANGLESGAMAIGEAGAFIQNPLVASSAVLLAEQATPTKPKNRNLFKSSGN